VVSFTDGMDIFPGHGNRKVERAIRKFVATMSKKEESQQ
jgi:hypothetical protein